MLNRTLRQLSNKDTDIVSLFDDVWKNSRQELNLDRSGVKKNHIQSIRLTRFILSAHFIAGSIEFYVMKGYI